VSADVIDVGCGGGTYTEAWHELGAATVTGVDFSGAILDAAREGHGHLPGVAFSHGDAAATGLPDDCADVVFQRALIYHVPDLAAVAAEAARLLEVENARRPVDPARAQRHRARPPDRRTPAPTPRGTDGRAGPVDRLAGRAGLSAVALFSSFPIPLGWGRVGPWTSAQC
jgi:SAM-dependent methyltransferase